MNSITSIEDSLDHLEEVLGPLIDKSLHETTSQLNVLQRAKLQVVLPYVVNDLIFMYLKTRGINPKTHPVIGELDRVKEYFEKIKNAEDPEKRKFVVDQQAATRFLKHALAESQATLERNRPHTQQGVHTRFTDATIEGGDQTAAALTKIQARAMANEDKRDSSDDSGDLEVFDEKEQKASTLAIDTQITSVEVETGKKRRRAMDPWTGYDEGTVTTTSNVKSSSEVERLQKESNRRLTSNENETISASMDIDIPNEGTDSLVSGPPQLKKNERNPREIIDIADLPTTSKFDKGTTSVINVDTLDSSCSSTPTGGKPKRKKKKK